MYFIINVPKLSPIDLICNLTLPVDWIFKTQFTDKTINFLSEIVKKSVFFAA